MTTRWACVAVILAGACLPGCSRRADEGFLDVGAVAPLTGPEARFGEVQRNGYQLAIEEINAGGGVQGRQLRLICEDDLDKPERCMSAVEKLITRKRVPAIVGPYSSAAALAATSVAERYRTPFLCPVGAHDDVTRRGFKWVFRTNAPSSVFASTMLDFLEAVAKPRNLAILFEDSGLGTSVAKAAREQAAARDLPVVAYESYAKGCPDFKPTISSIKARNPDVVLVVAYLMDAVLIMRQCREVDLNPTLFVGGGAGFSMPDLIADLGPTAEHVAVVTQWSETAGWPGARAFSKAYRRKYGQAPDYHAAACYAATHVLRDAFDRAGSLDREKVRAALQQTDLMTAFGPVKFEAYDGFTNQNRHQMLVLQVQKGKFETVWPRANASAKPVFPTPPWKDRK
jgi:branched-chain amino acid transport system substrate-binding protein